MHLTHSRSCIYFFLSIYTYALKNTVYGEIWRTIYQFWRFLSSYIKLPKRQLFLHFMILSKYLHIIYDGKYWWSNMFAAKGMKEKHRYFWKQIFIETFVFFFNFMILWSEICQIYYYILLKTCVFNMGTFQFSQAISFVI